MDQHSFHIPQIFGSKNCLIFKIFLAQEIWVKNFGVPRDVLAKDFRPKLFYVKIFGVQKNVLIKDNYVKNIFGFIVALLMK